MGYLLKHTFSKLERGVTMFFIATPKTEHCLHAANASSLIFVIYFCIFDKNKHNKHYFSNKFYALFPYPFDFTQHFFRLYKETLCCYLAIDITFCWILKKKPLWNGICSKQILRIFGSQSYRYIYQLNCLNLISRWTGSIVFQFSVLFHQNVDTGLMIWNANKCVLCSWFMWFCSLLSLYSLCIHLFAMANSAEK